MSCLLWMKDISSVRWQTRERVKKCMDLGKLLESWHCCTTQKEHQQLLLKQMESFIRWTDWTLTQFCGKMC